MRNASDSSDFPYVPVLGSLPDDDGQGTDVVVATDIFVEASAIARALGSTWGEAATETLLARAPLFWSRVRTARPCVRAELGAALSRAGVPVRYVASSRRQSMTLAPPIHAGNGEPIQAAGWREAPEGETPRDPDSEGRWFLREEPGGLALDRARCGTGRGTRLALIDDDAADFGQLDLDATVFVGIGRTSSASGHGAMMMGWAVGARTYEGSRFLGVAPGASVRAYLVPRPGDDTVPLALAIARAAIEGADVIVCATWVEGMMSPMLDDALELATRLGRAGRGCAVVFPTGREASSPKRSIHASLSLSLGDPASDPRVFCVAPGGRRGGWFWREQHGRLRPFSNRGPAVRFLAPGDDLAYPFLAEERLFHAESSGASAVAAGALLLVLANNSTMRVEELFAVLQRCATAPEPLPSEALEDLADRADVLPGGRDADGHDAKHGYGRIHVLRTCLAARDPVALALVSMGEDEGARVWTDARLGGAAAQAYSTTLSEWAVRAILADPSSEHALCVVLRHLRLVARDVRRSSAHQPGAIARQLALVVRALGRSVAGAPPPVHDELSRLEGALRKACDTDAGFEAAILDLARLVFAGEATPEARASSAGATTMRAGA